MRVTFEPMAPARMPFTRQMLLLQIGLVTLVVAVGFVLTAWILSDSLIEQYQRRALAVAESVSSDAVVGDAVASGDPEHIVQLRAEAVRVATGAAFVVVTDREGIRYAHPTPERLGERVSTDHTEVVAGNKVSNLQHGTLGLSARGKVPLFDHTGAIVGEVSVGFNADGIYDRLWSLLLVAAPLAVAALLLGVAGSALLARLLKQRTFGLEPHELAALVQQREALRELDSIHRLEGALRAQRHEFANRLHALSGLLQMQHHREAMEYVQALSGTPMLKPGTLTIADEALRDPYLHAFLSAKTLTAQEKGVVLELAETTWITTKVIAPVAVTTVVGNLVDNALEAAKLGSRRPARVEVDLIADGTTLLVSVTDTGDGVPDRLRESIFLEGVSTREGEGRGLGLALTRQAARSLGGDVRLTDPGGGDHGAVFVARLPEVLA